MLDAIRISNALSHPWLSGKDLWETDFSALGLAFAGL